MAGKYLKLSQTLKKFLFEYDMRQADLSRELDIPLPTVHRIVTGKSTRPNRSSLDAIAKYFNISVDQLTGEEIILPNKFDQIKSPLISKNAKMIPLTDWQTLELPIKKENIISEIMVIDVSEQAFATIMPDYSMEPAFQKGTTLIFDPKVEPTDRSYILVKLQASNYYVFRQLLIDADQKLIKSLNPDISSNSLRLLTPADTIIARLVEVRNKL